MITLTKKDKEVSITLEYRHEIGSKPMIKIVGEGDFEHHLVEGMFDILDRLARMDRIGHQSEEWTKNK